MSKKASRFLDQTFAFYKENERDAKSNTVREDRRVFRKSEQREGEGDEEVMVMTTEVMMMVSIMLIILMMMKWW